MQQYAIKWLQNWMLSAKITIPYSAHARASPSILNASAWNENSSGWHPPPAAKPSELDSLIQQITQLQYKNIDPKGCLFATEQIRLALDKLQPGQCKNKELEALFKQIVSKVLMDKNGAIQLKLKNGQIL